MAERLLGLGATPADIRQGDVPWVVLADPEGNTFCVMDEREAYRGTGALASLVLEGADPERDADFWAVATGWERVSGLTAASLRHPSGSGPLLEFLPESGPKRGKNRMHLDVRPGPDDGPVAAAVEDVGEDVAQLTHLARVAGRQDDPPRAHHVGGPWSTSAPAS